MGEVADANVWKWEKEVQKTMNIDSSQQFIACMPIQYFPWHC